MFEADYTRELIALGYRDAMAARDRLVPFVCGEPVHPQEPSWGATGTNHGSTVVAR